MLRESAGALLKVLGEELCLIDKDYPSYQTRISAANPGNGMTGKQEPTTVGCISLKDTAEDVIGYVFRPTPETAERNRLFLFLRFIIVEMVRIAIDMHGYCVEEQRLSVHMRKFQGMSRSRLDARRKLLSSSLPTL